MKGAEIFEAPLPVVAHDEPPVQAAVTSTAVTPAPNSKSLLQSLLDVPSRFEFDAAMAILSRATGRGDPGSAVRFEAALGLAFVPSDVLAVRARPNGYTVRTGLLGLTGPAGVLPRPYTETANAEARHRSPAFARFLDLLAQRPVAQFAQAGIKYRAHRTADAAAIGDSDGSRAPQDGLRDGLLSLVGYAEPGLLARLRPGPDPLLFYAGAFAARPRSADRLAALLSEWLGQPVEIEQFVGAWLELGRDQMSKLPRGGAGQFNRLGVDAAAGSRAWDIQSRVLLKIGPLSLAQFQALLPGSALLEALVALTRSYLGEETDFAINPILAAAAVPAPALGPESPSLLGWTGWLPVSGGRKQDAAEAKFRGAAAGA